MEHAAACQTRNTKSRRKAQLYTERDHEEKHLSMKTKATQLSAYGDGMRSPDAKRQRRCAALLHAAEPGSVTSDHTMLRRRSDANAAALDGSNTNLRSDDTPRAPSVHTYNQGSGNTHNQGSGDTHNQGSGNTQYQGSGDTHNQGSGDSSGCEVPRTQWDHEQRGQTSHAAVPTPAGHGAGSSTAFATSAEPTHQQAQGSQEQQQQSTHAPFQLLNLAQCQPQQQQQQLDSMQQQQQQQMQQQYFWHPQHGFVCAPFGMHPYGVPFGMHGGDAFGAAMGMLPHPLFAMPQGPGVFNANGGAMAGMEAGASTGSGAQQPDGCAHRAPSAEQVSPVTLPNSVAIHSINGRFHGTLWMREFLAGSSENLYGRLPPCVSQDGCTSRITPREAEVRAGKGSRKSWKLTLLTTHNGKEVSLQKYLTQLGLERPGSQLGAAAPPAIAHVFEDEPMQAGAAGDADEPAPAPKQPDACGTDANRRACSPEAAAPESRAGADAQPGSEESSVDDGGAAAADGRRTVSPTPCGGDDGGASAHSPPGPGVALDGALLHTSDLKGDTDAMNEQTNACNSSATAAQASTSHGPAIRHSSDLSNADSAAAAAEAPAGSGGTGSVPPITSHAQLATLPVTISVFTSDECVRGTFFLHDYVQCSNLARPPPCVVLVPEGDAAELGGQRVTPRVAEAKAGREARKNWKETFRTVFEGRVISLKAFFALYNL